MASLSNIFIDQGSDFINELEVVDSQGIAINLTGYTVISQLRKTYGSNTFTSFITQINSDPTTGKISISLSAAQTASLEQGRYVYDVLITSTGGLSTRVVEGIATLTPGVSRS